VCARQYHDCDDLVTVPYIGDNSRLWRLIVRTAALPGDGPVRPEICRRLVKLIIKTLKFVICLSNFLTFSILYVG